MIKDVTDITVLKNGENNDKEPFHYTACGLDNVYLLGGYFIEKTSYGEAVTINNIHALHKTIGWHLIGLARPLDPKEFRFLRKEMGHSQQKFGELLGGIGVQTIARYEKDETAINGSTERLARLMYALNLMNEEDKKAMLASITKAFESELDDEKSSIYLNETSGAWIEQVC